MGTVLIWLEFAVLLGCIFIGSRYGGVGLGLWGSFGVFVLTYLSFAQSNDNELRPKQDEQPRG